jgi:hypothetical protein
MQAVRINIPRKIGIRITVLMTFEGKELRPSLQGSAIKLSHSADKHPLILSLVEG